MTSDIFQKREIRHRLSSAFNPHSNCRAELAVKVGKKLLRDNMGHGGSLDTNKFMRAEQYPRKPKCGLELQIFIELGLQAARRI